MAMTFSHKRLWHMYRALAIEENLLRDVIYFDNPHGLAILRKQRVDCGRESPSSGSTLVE